MAQEALELTLDANGQDAFLRLSHCLPAVAKQYGDTSLDLGFHLLAFEPSGEAVLKAALSAPWATLKSVAADLQTVAAQTKHAPTRKLLQDTAEKVLALKGRAVPQTDPTREKSGVYLRLPDELAKQFPEKKEDPSPPHATLLFIGGLTADEFRKVVDQVRSVASQTEPFKVHVTDYGEFTSHEGKVIPHMVPRGEGTDLAALHDKLRKNVESILNRKSEHRDGPFKSHITLAYQEPGTKYSGPRPQGSFMANELEVWGEDKGKFGRVAIKLGTGDLVAQQNRTLETPPTDVEPVESYLTTTNAVPNNNPVVMPPGVGKRDTTAKVGQPMPANVEPLDPRANTAPSASLQGLSPTELAQGIVTESATQSDPVLAGRTAVENLRGNPKYYSRFTEALRAGHPHDRARELAREQKDAEIEHNVHLQPVAPPTPTPPPPASTPEKAPASPVAASPPAPVAQEPKKPAEAPKSPAEAPEAAQKCDPKKKPDGKFIFGSNENATSDASSSSGTATSTAMRAPASKAAVMLYDDAAQTFEEPLVGYHAVVGPFAKRLYEELSKGARTVVKFDEPVVATYDLLTVANELQERQDAFLVQIATKSAVPMEDCMVVRGVFKFAGEAEATFKSAKAKAVLPVLKLEA